MKLSKHLFRIKFIGIHTPRLAFMLSYINFSLDIILKDVVLYLLCNRFVPAVKIMPAPLDSVWNVGSGSVKPALKRIKGSNLLRTIKYAKKRKYLLVRAVDSFISIFNCLYLQGSCDIVFIMLKDALVL